MGELIDWVADRVPVEERRLIEALTSSLKDMDEVVESVKLGVLDAVGVWVRDAIGAVSEEDNVPAVFDVVELCVRLPENVPFEEERSRLSDTVDESLGERLREWVASCVDDPNVIVCEGEALVD